MKQKKQKHSHTGMASILVVGMTNISSKKDCSAGRFFFRKSFIGIIHGSGDQKRSRKLKLKVKLNLILKKKKKPNDKLSTINRVPFPSLPNSRSLLSFWRTLPISTRVLSTSPLGVVEMIWNWSG
jgi:hypothetical protein